MAQHVLLRLIAVSYFSLLLHIFSIWQASSLGGQAPGNIFSLFFSPQLENTLSDMLFLLPHISSIHTSYRPDVLCVGVTRIMFNTL